MTEVRLTFLEAASKVSLTKRFRIDPNTDDWQEVASYPMVKRFTSYEEVCSDFESFAGSIIAHANQGHCLLRGALVQPIKDSPRRNLHVSDPFTRWIVLDYDSPYGFSSPDDLLHALDLPALPYLFHHSASAGLTSPAGIRGHLFFLLEEPVRLSAIANWLQWVNLTVPELSSQITLTATGHALKWPLDIAVARSAQLIFIAPPEVEGAADPLPDRFEPREFSSRTRTSIVEQIHTVPTDKLAKLIRQRLINLREQAGLPPLPRRLTITNDERRVVLNPQAISPIQSWTIVEENEQFIRLNINGGDSRAYYVLKHNPRYLHNFKGEPDIDLKECCPELYQELLAKIREDKRRLLCLWDLETNMYYGVEYLPESNEVLHVYSFTTKNAILDLQKLRGEPGSTELVPDFKVYFDPKDSNRIDLDRKKFNLYEPPPPNLDPTKVTPAGANAKIPPVIHKVIDHVCCGEQEVIDHFLNWLAFVYRKRTMSQTAWVFFGTYGTGKGTLGNRIVRPLVGDNQFCPMTLDKVIDKFDAWIRHTLVLFIDETDSNSLSKTTAAALRGRLKHLITEPMVTVRPMFRGPIVVPNHINVIIASNETIPIHVYEGDRRYNVAPRQLEPLQITASEYDRIDDELPQFARFLIQWKIDEHQVRTPIDTDARRDLISLSTSPIDDVLSQLSRGELDTLYDMLNAIPTTDPSMQIEISDSLDDLNRVVTEFARTGQAEFLSERSLLRILRLTTRERLQPKTLRYMLSLKGGRIRCGTQTDERGVSSFGVWIRPELPRCTRFLSLQGQGVPDPGTPSRAEAQ